MVQNTKTVPTIPEDTPKYNSTTAEEIKAGICKTVNYFLMDEVQN